MKSIKRKIPVIKNIFPILFITAGSVVMVFLALLYYTIGSLLITLCLLIASASMSITAGLLYIRKLNEAYK